MSISKSALTRRSFVAAAAVAGLAACTSTTETDDGSSSASGSSTTEAASATAEVSYSGQGIVVTENEESATGYTVSVFYDDSEATNVTLSGGFQFYEAGDINVWSNGFVLPEGDSQANYLYDYTEWTADKDLKHLKDIGSEVVLEQDEDGVWTADIDLPGGFYNYGFSVSYDGGETYESVLDPTNIPFNVELGSNPQGCKFYVPYAEVQGDDYYDWSWATAPEDSDDEGTVEGFTYAGLDGDQLAEIYLPVGYDAAHDEPYKVLYLSHGGGGDEGDWFYAGNAKNISDRLIAEGAVEEFIIVCMNNTVYNGNFESASSNEEYFAYCGQNIVEYLIPYVEANYNVSSDPEDRAFAGYSNGAKQTTYMYIAYPDQFSYFGLFSGSGAWMWPELDDYSAYQSANVYLGAGYADQLMMQDTYHTDTDKTLMGMKELLEEAGITYNNGEGYVTVEGAHDFWTWQQLFKDYVETTLWK